MAEIITESPLFNETFSHKISNKVNAVGGATGEYYFMFMFRINIMAAPFFLLFRKRL